MIKVDKDGTDITNVKENKKEIKGLSVFPNPFNSSFTVTSGENLLGVFEMYDISGSKVLEEKINGLSHMIYAETLGKGVYFYRFINSNGDVFNGKIMMQ